MVLVATEDVVVAEVPFGVPPMAATGATCGTKGTAGLEAFPCRPRPTRWTLVSEIWVLSTRGLVLAMHEGAITINAVAPTTTAIATPKRILLKESVTPEIIKKKAAT